MADKTCFVIAPIGATDSESRKRSDQVLKHIIRPAVKLCGYEAIRADEISEPGIITSQVIQHIVDDALVIADLTERNPNVFYELALHHAIRKPLVQIISKGEQIPFDVAGMRTIPIDHHDLDSVEETKAEIIKQIEAIGKVNARIETPISVAVELQALRQSDNPEQRSLADLLAATADLRTAMASIEKRLSDLCTLIPLRDYLVHAKPGISFDTAVGLEAFAGEREQERLVEGRLAGLETSHANLSKSISLSLRRSHANVIKSGRRRGRVDFNLLD